MAFGGEIVGAIAAVAGAVISYESAQQQNKAVKKAQRAQIEAAKVQTKQLNEQAGLEKIKRLRELAAIEGRIKVSAAGAGLATTGSFDALANQAARDATENLSILDQNKNNQQARINSGLNVDLATLDSQKRNSVLDAFSGGLTGLSTGLSIASGIKNIAPKK